MSMSWIEASQATYCALIVARLRQYAHVFDDHVLCSTRRGGVGSWKRFRPDHPRIYLFVRTGAYLCPLSTFPLFSLLSCIVYAALSPPFFHLFFLSSFTVRSPLTTKAVSVFFSYRSGQRTARDTHALNTCVYLTLPSSTTLT